MVSDSINNSHGHKWERDTIRAPQIFANYSFKSLYLKQKKDIMLHFYIVSNHYCIYRHDNSVFITLTLLKMLNGLAEITQLTEAEPKLECRLAAPLNFKAAFITGYELS